MKEKYFEKLNAFVIIELSSTSRSSSLSRLNNLHIYSLWVVWEVGKSSHLFTHSSFIENDTETETNESSEEICSNEILLTFLNSYENTFIKLHLTWMFIKAWDALQCLKTTLTSLQFDRMLKFINCLIF